MTSAIDRILVMARIHERLRAGPGSTAIVDARAFLADLCDEARISLIDGRPIAIAIVAPSCELSHGRAVTIGLIVNEAVTNAVAHAFPKHAFPEHAFPEHAFPEQAFPKHVFPEQRAGTVTVSLVERAGTFVLRVSDDGVGFDPEAQPVIGGVGCSLLHSLSRQIGGDLRIAPNEGAPGMAVTVSFPSLAR